MLTQSDSRTSQCERGLWLDRAQERQEHNTPQYFPQNTCFKSGIYICEKIISPTMLPRRQMYYTHEGGSCSLGSLPYQLSALPFPWGRKVWWCVPYYLGARHISDPTSLQYSGMVDPHSHGLTAAVASQVSSLLSVTMVTIRRRAIVAQLLLAKVYLDADGIPRALWE